MNVCAQCASHYNISETTCPHCATKGVSSPRVGRRGRGLAAALGVSLVMSVGASACIIPQPVYGGPPEEEREDTGVDMDQVDSGEDMRPIDAPAYGAPPQE